VYLLLQARVGSAFGVNPLAVLSFSVLAISAVAVPARLALGSWIAIRLTGRGRRIAYLAVATAVLLNWAYLLLA